MSGNNTRPLLFSTWLSGSSRENGVAGITVRVMMAEAGVNVAAINYYFRSGKDLYREAVGRHVAPLS